MARVRRLVQAAPPPAQEAMEAAAQVQPAEVQPPPEAPADDLQFRYTRTRCVEISYDLLRQNRIVSAFERSLFTDAYKILSTQVSQKLRLNGWNTLGITSAGSGEGKTLTAINLAISLASEFHQSALLVDADLRHPSVSAAFGLHSAPGLTEYLMADTPIADMLIHPDIDRLVILPAGAGLVNSSAALGWRRMADLVKELKNRYPSRLVVFDLPPLLHIGDVLAFAPCIEAALLVVEEGKTSRHDLERAQQLLSGTHLLGTVLNKSRELKLPRDNSARWLGGLLKRIGH
jgi:protein-tyrosine kinase